jgi:hypothetical protein
MTGNMTKKSEMTKKISACAFGLMLAVLVVPTGVARADETDGEFVQFVQSHGINLGSVSQTANIAREMCKDLAAGFSQKDEIGELTNSNKLNQQQAEFFVGAATANYCPDKHPPSKPAGG